MLILYVKNKQKKSSQKAKTITNVNNFSRANSKLHKVLILIHKLDRNQFYLQFDNMCGLNNLT